MFVQQKFVLVCLALSAAAAAQSVHPIGGSASPQKSPVPVQSGSFPQNPVGNGNLVAAGSSKVPQLSVADILALRRAVQQRQLLSRSGVVSPSSGRLPHPYGYNFVGDSVRAQFADLSGPGAAYGDYMASGSAPPPKAVKPSISTRFRSFMNSLFFRSSSSVAPAFYQPAPGTIYRPGPASYLPQPAQQPRIPPDFSAKSSAGYPTSFTGVSNKPVKDYSSASLPSKPSFVPSYSSSVSSSVSSSSPSSKASSAVSPISSASNPHASVATASGFYPSMPISSSSSSPSSSYDKSRFSSLYGSNGFTAKASPVKSSKSIKTHLPSGASDEKFPEADEIADHLKKKKPSKLQEPPTV
ncbi:putative protein TPRXL [Galendromus occidentalis]|uniref:Uncharacterized protein n=1 Tax=Galendromus occidentalis TaxID=34638 RepID=A0AAJ7WIX5_9ACAR|nr:putative protein TPRXL [Galendromus occidentalis]